MNATLNPSYLQPTGVLRALRAMVAAALLLVGTNAALAAVVVSTDRVTMGDWIGTYGSCAYVLPSAKVAPGVETPILPGTGVCTTATCGDDGLPPLTGGGGNYGGGASSDLHDCRGQTTTAGFSDNISYNVRLCSQPPGWESTFAQGYVWTNPFPPFNVDPAGCMMLPGYPTFAQTLEFPTDTRGLASCTPLGQGCTFRTEPNGTAGRIASTWDDLSENKSIPASGAGLCVDVNFSGLSAAQRALSYKLSGYFLDYDNVGRDLIVQLFDGATPLAPATPISGFGTGAYLNFSNLTPLPTSLTLQIFRIGAGDVNAVLSGLFLDRSDGSSCQVPPVPHITLKKLTNSVDNPGTNGVPLPPQVVPGGVVTWTYIVTNDGTENLVGISLTDTPVGPIACPLTALAVGQSMTCTKTGVAQTLTLPGANTVAGVCGSQQNRPLYENNGHVVGFGQTTNTQVSADYKSHYCNPPVPHITVKKLTNGVDNPGTNGVPPPPQIVPGGPVTWTYIVTNDGTEDLVNVAVNDDKVGFICTVGALNVGASATCTKNGTAQLVPTGGVTGVCSGPGRPLYENMGTATGNGAGSGTPVSATYLSHYCNPPVPHITVKKLTNTVDNPGTNGVPPPPVIVPGGPVTWTYIVTNDGTENLVNVAVNDDKVGFICTVGALNVGASATCTKNGTAQLIPTGGVTGVCGGVPGLPLYENKGTATGSGAVSLIPVSATYLSHYCNPPPIPCPDGSFTFSVDANGNLNIKFDQFPAPNDNSYGANAVGWGTKGHKFSDLVGSDKAGFQLVNPSGVVVLDFNIDYISATTASAAFPSGYKSFGPFGGDGKVNVGTLVDQTDITYTSSLANNLNNINIPGLFSGGVQQFGTGVANVLTDSPPTLDKISNYTLTPAAIAAGFSGWDFHDTYFVTLKKAKLVALGAVDPITNQLRTGWKVQPNLTALHNSPAKACPGASGGKCDLDSGDTTVDKKAFKWSITNSGTATATLTDVSVSWPAANGNLLQIKLDGDVVYGTSTPPSSVTLTSGQLTTDAKKKSIDKGKTRVFSLNFANNAEGTPYLITLRFGTDASCVLTFDSTNQPMTLAACNDTKPIENLVLEYSGTKAISNVAFYRTSSTGVPGASDKIGDTGAVDIGEIVSFGNYDAANATNDVDFQITFTDNTTQKSRFHLSCSDSAMNDIADCGTVQGNGKDNSVTGGNLWLLRDIQGQGKHVCNFP